MKKIICLILSFVFAAMAVCGVFAVEHKPGDVNGDGSVNNKDVVSLFRFVNGEEDAATEEYCDINGDGSINNKDVVALFKAVSAGDTPHIHTFGDETVTEEPTCTTPGKSIRTCTECGYTEVTDIPALGHILEHHDGQIPTCTRIGWTDYYECLRPGCGYTTYKEYEMEGHDYAAATCTTPKTCTRCGKTEGSAAGHKPGNWEVKTPATTTTEGQEVQKCTVCGTVVNTRVIPKITSTHTHTWQRYVINTNIAPQDVPFKVPDEHEGHYYQRNQWAIYYCTECREADWSTHEYGKSQAEAATEFFSYLNPLRNSLEEPNVYRSDYLDGIAQQRAVELISNYSHVGQRTSGECINTGNKTVYDSFVGWCNSTGHYEIMTCLGNVYMGYGYAMDPYSYFLYA